MTEVRGSIDEVNRRFVETFNQGKPGRAAEQVYRADARLLPPDAPIMEGRNAAIQFWETATQQLGIRSVQLTTVSLEIVGGVPYEIGHADVNLQSGQQVRFKYVVIWKQEDGRWRWHVDIWNTRPSSSDWSRYLAPLARLPSTRLRIG